MHKQVQNAPTEDAVQQRLAGLAREVEALGALIADDPHWYERPAALAEMANAQECLNSLSAHSHASSSAAIPPTSHLLEQDERVVTRAQVGEIARSLHTVRVQVQHDAHVLRELTTSRSWRMTRPVRSIMEFVRYPDLFRKKLKRLLGLTGLRVDTGRQFKSDADEGARLVALPALPPDLALVEAELKLLRLALPAMQARNVDIYMWGVIDWHFRYQRPQHLARVLAARGHRVFYISNEFIDRPFPGFTLEPLADHGRLYQVHLYLKDRPPIYTDGPLPAQITQLDAGLGQFALWSGVEESVSILHHSYWRKLTSGIPHTLVVYDCLDHQAGFSNNSSSILAEERSLLKSADLVIATSQWLKEELADVASEQITVIRNAGEYEFFSQRPAHVFADPAGRKIIGYYGAIDSWFDLALVRAIAKRFPQHLVLLIGRDSAGAARSLSDLANVQWINEVNYAELPFWLYGFDVCLLPFQVLPLTLATNPVKIYEYLSAGKPVVAVDLPEMAQFGDLIRIGSTQGAFLDAVAATLDGREDASLPRRRREFAARQTWEHRVDALEDAIERVAVPHVRARVSVIVVTYGNLRFTRNCLDSLQRFSGWPNLEVIVVDNGSQDGTPEFLEAWRGMDESRHIILNADNRGFAAANNQGLAAATGEYLILLNNDTYVTQGWVRGLVSHLRSDEGIGLAGPVTNNIGNEARIDIDYSDMEEMAERSRQYTTRHRGRSFDISTPAFFCVAMTRITYEKVGPLDEAFGVGFFEDDDYCRRIEQVGLRCVCAEDVFIHHHLSASFDELKQEDRKALFERNKLIYENKWGPWRPHVYR